MAIISGRYGAVDFASVIAYVRDWTVDYSAELFDVSNFDESSGGRSRISGIPDWTGSFSAYFTSGNAAVTPGTSGAAVFRTSATGTADLLYGGVILMGYTITTPVDGPVAHNYTFQGIGTPAQTTA